MSLPTIANLIAKVTLKVISKLDFKQKGNFSTHSFLLASTAYVMPFSPRGVFVVHWTPSHTGESIPPAIVTGVWLSSKLKSADLNATSNAVAPHARLAHSVLIVHVFVDSSWVQHSVEGHGLDTDGGTATKTILWILKMIVREPYHDKGAARLKTLKNDQKWSFWDPKMSFLRVFGLFRKKL